MKKPKSKQLSFKFCILLSNMMKPLAILLRLAQDVNHPFVQSMHAVHTAPLSH